MCPMNIKKQAKARFNLDPKKKKNVETYLEDECVEEQSEKAVGTMGETETQKNCERKSEMSRFWHL